jgi:hypothetical protein
VAPPILAQVAAIATAIVRFSMFPSGLREVSQSRQVVRFSQVEGIEAIEALKEVWAGLLQFN